MTSTRVKAQRPSAPPPGGGRGRDGDVGAHHPGPLLEQAGRRRQPDARGRARHDVGPTVQSTHGTLRFGCARVTRADRSSALF